ncbi:MAG: RDD family protein [Pseudomonadota bacterium]
MTNEQPIYAGFWVRVFAGLLDMAFLLPIFVILFFFFGIDDFQSIKIHSDLQNFSSFNASSHNPYFHYLNYAVSIAYVAYFLSSKKQATFGKRIMGIYVGNPDGSKLSAARAIARALAGLLSAATLGLAYLPIIFTAEKTALHDLICNTRVFHGKKNE